MKTGRNAPCPCGSGKKYKKCCLNTNQQTGKKHFDSEGAGRQPSRKTDQNIPPAMPGIDIRPYALAKMCDPKNNHVQQMFRLYPELKKNVAKMVTVSQMRSLTTQQVIEKMMRYGVQYDEEQFLATCEKMDSAWDVAETLWPEQLKSLEPSVSDISGLGACVLWERLFHEKKLTRVSFEMLDDWMENGYALLDEDCFQACRIWMRVWKTFTDIYDVAGLSIKQIDARFKGSQSFFNWCQDFEMALINASIDEKEFAEIGVSFLDEFVTCFADEDTDFVNQFKSSLGELYCRAGNQDTGEKVLADLIRKHPDRGVGYIGMETAVSIRKMDDESSALKERLNILEMAKNAPVMDGESYDLDRRIRHLKEMIQDLTAKRQDNPQ